METIENMVIQLKWSAIWSEICALFGDRTSVQYELDLKSQV